MIVVGIGEWDTSTALRIDEPRLSAKLGVDFFRRPPYYRHQEQAGGIPARLFPRYLVCPRCSRLARHTQFTFKEWSRGPEYVCTASHAGGREQVVFPARFMVACPRGHLDDFPWHEYAHGGRTECDADLSLWDSGRTGAITDLWVRCTLHRRPMNVGQAMGAAARTRLPRCSGARPWLGPDNRQSCDEEVRVILRGASNAYFPVVESAISVPPWSDPIQLAVGEHIEALDRVDSVEKVKQWQEIVSAPSLADFAPDRIWEAIERRRSRSGQVQVADLRREEWAALTSTRHRTDPGSEFQVRPIPVPEEVAALVSGVTQVVRLREVRALRGFTRIDPIPDIGDLGEVEAVKAGLAPIASSRLEWLPGVDLRGEGIFLKLDDARVAAWERDPAIRDLEAVHQQAQRDWYRERGMEQSAGRPARYLLLHSLAHLLIRQLGLDCGYASASLRERIYSSGGANPMAGILVYTASVDSEGSLGGLVEMSRPELLGTMIKHALRNSKLCANDPLCADREPAATGTQLNGAACHACLLEAETSCESGNNYLDRAVLAGTLRKSELAFVRG